MKKILFVEDDLMIIRIYRGKFEAEGYKVEVANDGESAIAALGKFSPDLVVLDLQLPKLNGVEVLKHIRANHDRKDIPVIVFSNAFLSSMVDEAKKAGATTCLTKANCTPKQLLDVIKGSLEGSSTAAVAPGEPAVTTHGRIPPSPALSQLAEEANAWAASVRPGAPPPRFDPAAFNSPEGSTENPFSPPGASGGRKNGDGMDAQSQGVIRRIFLDACPHTLTTLRAHLLTLTRNQSEEGGVAKHMSEMFGALHSLTGNAGLAGFRRIAQMSSALEALVQELQDKPANINASSLRTLASGVDALGGLFETSSQPGVDAWPATQALVVDDDLICSRAVCSALDLACIKSVRVDDPEIALKLLEHNRFDLIFLDVDMPKMTGFELSTKLRALPTNKTAPVIFVTSLNTFESRASSTLSGGTDLIAKPFLLIEMAVKALTYLIKGTSRPAVARA